MRVFQVEPHAYSIPFDNSTNGFISDRVQPAIEEARLYAQGFPRAGVRGSYNGTVSNRDWLGPNELLSNTPFVVFPVRTQINEISWANSKNDPEFHIEFRSMSQTGTIFHTLTVTAPNDNYGYQNNLTYTFNPGTTLWIQYWDDGQNAADLDLIVWISRVP